MAQRMSATQQVQVEGRIPLCYDETIWMEGLESAIIIFRRLNPDGAIHGVPSSHTHMDNGQWVIGLRCGQAGFSYAHIVLDYGYHLEWRD